MNYHDIIDLEQSAFVPRKLITYSILVAFECLHSIKKWDQGRKGIMAIELDMNKAYNQVECDFICVVLHRLRFSPKWIERVTDYLSTTHFLIMLGGKPSGYFRISRGLRQGCP